MLIHKSERLRIGTGTNLPPTSAMARLTSGR
jgi:hypothetical protein